MRRIAQFEISTPEDVSRGYSVGTSVDKAKSEIILDGYTLRRVVDVNVTMDVNGQSAVTITLRPVSVTMTGGKILIECQEIDNMEKIVRMAGKHGGITQQDILKQALEELTQKLNGPAPSQKPVTDKQVYKSQAGVAPLEEEDGVDKIPF